LTTYNEYHGGRLIRYRKCFLFASIWVLPRFLMGSVLLSFLCCLVFLCFVCLRPIHVSCVHGVAIVSLIKSLPCFYVVSYCSRCGFLWDMLWVVVYPFSFDNCIVCPSLIYGSDYSFGIFKLFLIHYLFYHITMIYIEFYFRNPKRPYINLHDLHRYIFVRVVVRSKK
jgi:hypothetical protein